MPGLLALALLLAAAVSTRPALAQGSNPGMIITNQDGEALQINARGNFALTEDMPGGFGEHSTVYSTGGASGSVSVANPEWNTVRPDGSTVSLGGASTNVDSRFLEPGHYILSNAGAVRVTDSAAGTSNASAVVAGAQLGIDVEDKTSPAILIKVVPQNSYQENSCAVKEEPLDVHPAADKTFGIHVLGPNFDPSLQAGRAPEPVSREKLVAAGRGGSGGTVQNTFNLDSRLDPSMPEGRLYVPEDVRCGLSVEYADNDPAQAVPGDPSSTYQPATRWYEVHCLREAGAEPEIVRDPATYIFRAPTDEVNGPVYAIVAYARDRTGNTTLVRIPVTVLAGSMAVKRIEFD
ncbi:MAG: hypothetical protein FD129_1864, partial [bacterium]